jgi:solute carrier family 25 protein 16
MLLFGAASGLVAQTITYPLDLVRRRMQVHSLAAQPLQPPHAHAGHAPHAPQHGVQRHPSHHHAGPLPEALARGLHNSSGSPAPSTWQTVQELHSRGGLRAFYRGLSLNYIKVVPSTAIGFTIYDALKAYLDLSGNI